METNLDTLTVLAEVTIAFVAFAAIIATLRRTFGEQLSPFQRLLTRWFIETGMLTVSIELLPLVLAGFLRNEVTVARYSIFYALIVSLAYLIYYIRRRIIIKAPTPLASLLVMIGSAIWLLVLAMAGAGIVLPPSLAIVVAFSFWLLLSAAIIFVTYLATFVFDEDPSA
ncbi:MAG: hypothetical protein ACYSR5_12025 [Planctomycetota bacterium]|jgi:hypothetical protein